MGTLNMSRGINKVILIGNLGADPELRYAPGGSPCASLSLATSENWKDKQTGEDKERTEWHRVVLFNRLAEIANQFLRKGSKVYIEGSIRTQKWQDKNGQDRYTTEIVGANMQMLDPRSMEAVQPSLQAASELKTAAVEKAGADNAAVATAAAEAGVDDGFDGDIPF